MKFSACLLAGLSLFALTGCLSTSGPLWLEAGDVNTKDMKTYSKQRVIVLPVEVNPSLDVDDDSLRAIQDQVKNNLVRVFGLRKVESLGKIERLHAFPYQQKEIIELGKVYGAGLGAIAAISIFSMVRKDEFVNSRIGVRITFADVQTPGKSWTMSREYRSGSGFESDSTRFNNTLNEDFKTIAQRLDAGRGFFGFLTPRQGRDAKAPRVYLYFPDDLNEGGVTQTSVNAAPAAAAVTKEAPNVRYTENSQYFIRLQADDTTGLVTTVITNRRNSFRTELHHTPGNVPLGDAAHYANELVMVPLEAGENVIEFVTTNQVPKSTTRSVTIYRKPKETVYALGVGIDNYKQFAASTFKATEVEQQLTNAAAQQSQTFHFLANEDATQQAIERGLYDMSDRVALNDQGIGLFYFAGKVESRKDGTYLVAYDSEKKQVEVTGVRVAELQKILPGNTVVMLDLCEPNESVQKQLMAELPKATMTFDSCEPGASGLANALEKQHTEKKVPLKQAVETVVKDYKK